jgi:hypothetical protein
MSDICEVSNGARVVIKCLKDILISALEQVIHVYGDGGIPQTVHLFSKYVYNF